MGFLLVTIVRNEEGHGDGVEESSRSVMFITILSLPISFSVALISRCTAYSVVEYRSFLPGSYGTGAALHSEFWGWRPTHVQAPNSSILL
jgi:hypothetical protein